MSNIISTITSQPNKALNETIAGMGLPQNPPFLLNAEFPDSEWAHFFRILAVSIAFAGIGSTVAADAKGEALSFVPDAHSLRILGLFACFGAFYHLYARLFGIRISVRQSLFCFALVLTPWLPFYVILKAAGAKLNLLWWILMPGLWLYVLYLVFYALRTVSGAGSFRVSVSLLLLVIALIWMTLY